MQSNNLNNHSSLDFQFSLKFSTFLHPYKCSATSSTSKMNKLLAEVGSLVTSLVTLPQTVLSGPHNCLKTIISVSKLSNTFSPYSFCCIFFLIKSFWNFLAFFSEHTLIWYLEEMFKCNVPLFRGDQLWSQGTRALDASLILLPTGLLPASEFVRVLCKN